MRWAALLMLALATTSHATPILLSGFDGADQSTTNTDSLEWTCTADGSTDARVDIQKTVTHDTASGGDSSSKFAQKATITADGQYGSCRLVSNLTPRPILSLAVAMHVATPPASGERRVVAAMVEEGSDLGCALALNSDRTMSIFYAGGVGEGSCTTDANCSGTALCIGSTGAKVCRAQWGAIPTVFQVEHCSSDAAKPCTDATVATDCPASDTCTGTFFGNVTLTQVRGNADVVTCEAKMNGRTITAGVQRTVSVNPVGQVINVDLGVLNAGTTGVTTIYHDSVALDDTDAGWGYVARLVPGTSGALQQWSTNSGGSCAGGTRPNCVNDYNIATDYTYFNDASNNSLGRGAANKAEEFATLTPSLSLPTGASVTAIEGLAFGNTTAGTGIRDLQQKLIIAGTPVLGPVVEVVATGAAQTVVKLWSRLLVTSAPIAGSSALGPHVNALGHGIATGPNIAATLRVGAMLVYVRVRRPDELGAITLPDRNGDGKVVIAGLGDSTLVGTAETNCSNSSNVCSAVSFCNWSTTRDQPTGGCGEAGALNDATCRTCTNRRSEFAAGAGYPCWDASCGASCDSNCSLGTCSGGFCTGDTTVACTVSGDCDLGTCDEAATCSESCPGGTCPTARVGWMASLGARVNADAIIACGQGGEDMGQMVANRFQAVLAGSHASCEAVSGSGACTCTTGTVTADCGAGGTCTSNLCVAGDLGRTNCVTNSGCNVGRVCQFPAPDYLVTLEDYNAPFPFGIGEVGSPPGNVGVMHDPECKTPTAIWGALSTQPLKGCPTYAASGAFTCPVTACTVDSDGASLSPQSVCFGRCTNKDQGCKAPVDCGNLFSTDCTAYSYGCASDADCALGATCDGGDATWPGRLQGICRPASDANCPANYKAIGPVGKKMCRRACASGVDTSCGAQSSCVSVDTPTADANGTFVCRGRASCPCDAISCMADSDCGPAPDGATILTNRTGGFRKRVLRGTCNLARGKCTACGLVSCGDEARLVGPCSCTSNAECDTSGGSGDGVCTHNVCTAGKPTRTSCTSATQCASGRQCLRPTRQFQAFQAGYYGLARQMSKRMTDIVEAMPAGTRPRLLFAELPTPGGLTSSGTTVNDTSCEGGWFARDYFQSVGDSYRSAPWIAARHVVNCPSFQNRRMRLPFRVDQTHFATLGSNEVSICLADTLNRLNVCLKTDGVTPQKYCQAATGTWTSTICETSSDCAAGASCFRRRCDGSAGNCPDGGDSCGGD